jgi:hypothetical protein
MSEERPIRQQHVLDVVGRAIAAGRQGLRLTSSLTYEGWLEIGSALGDVARCSGWMIGDWILHGQASYGRKYALALDVTGLDYKSLRNYASLAGRFELSRRRDTLSIGHHEAVASLPVDKQEYWLDRAERDGMSRQQLRHAVRASADIAARKTGQAQLGQRGISRLRRDTTVALKLPVTAEKEVRWRRAADLARVDFVEWVIAALDAATEIPNLYAQAANGHSPRHGHARADGPRRSPSSVVASLVSA